MAKKPFSVNPPSWTGRLFRPVVFITLVACLTFGLPCLAMGARNQTRGQSSPLNRALHQNRSPVSSMAADENSGKATAASKEEKGAYNKNVERWKTLPSDEKKELRNRMDQWRNLSPQQQDTYRRRYEKLQKMTPNERKKVDQGLEKWDTLSPKEKEEIRREFEE